MYGKLRKRDLAENREVHGQVHSLSILLLFFRFFSPRALRGNKSRPQSRSKKFDRIAYETNPGTGIFKQASPLFFGVFRHNHEFFLPFIFFLTYSFTLFKSRI
jgi:hypothetical protein